MALKKLPGGVIVETDGGARLNEEAGINLEAIHRQLAGQSAATADALNTKADVVALNTVRSEALAAKSAATEARSVASTAQSTAGAAKSTADNANVRVTALESAAGFGPSTPTDGTISTYMEQADSLTSASASRHAQRRTRTLYPEDFGAKGDGVADDTAALEAWLASPSLSLRMGAGRYKATRPLTSTVAGRTIWADGGTILADMPEEVVLNVTGANTRVKLNIDGQHKARGGLRFVAPGCDASESEVRRFRTFEGFADGIRAETLGGFRCVRAVIDDVLIERATEEAGQNSAAHGIYLGVPSGGNSYATSVIHDNQITNIRGFGAGIQIINTSNASGTPFAYMRASVKNNMIEGFSRRAIKVQASGVTLRDNDCQDYATTETGIEHAIIYVLNSDDSRVIGNRAYGKTFAYGLNVSMTSGMRHSKRTVVVGNHAEIGPSKGTAAYISRHDGAVITDNRATGGLIGMNILLTPGSTVERNVGVDSPRPLVIPNAQDGSRLTRNYSMGNSGPEEVAVADQYKWARARSMDDTPLPSNTTRRIVWKDWEGNAATHSDGIITPEPGRYLVQVSIAGQPVNASGWLSLHIINDPEGVVRYERLGIASKSLQTWSTTAVVTVRAGGRLWVNAHHINGADLPLNATSRLPLLSLERLD